MYELAIFAAGLGVASIFFMFRALEILRTEVKEVKNENSAIKAENAVLKEASKKHMPYQKIEDLENAKAMLILANEELKALGLYLDQARSDPRGKK